MMPLMMMMMNLCVQEEALPWALSEKLGLLEARFPPPLWQLSLL